MPRLCQAAAAIAVLFLVCVTPQVASQSLGDPHFVGLRGQSYQLHGLVDGAVYNLITEQHTQVNARFTFLTDGDCPFLNGQPDSNCFSHPGFYMNELSFQTVSVSGGELYSVVIVAGTAQHGFAVVEVNGKVLKMSDTVEFSDDFQVQFIGHHRVYITMPNFRFTLSNSDLYINQAIHTTTPLSKLKSHGLIGQTHSNTTYTTELLSIEGDVNDYMILDGNLFGSEFAYNQFEE